MYPCSNPELVAAVSGAGALGVIQPLSLTYVHGHDLVEGIRYMKSLTDRPLGFNALIEKSARKYRERMENWIDLALEEGIRFFITSLGKPDWVVDKVHAYGGVVYHDVSEKKWADIGAACGVDGLIAVNNRAGGHCGRESAQQLFDQLEGYNLPLVCAGGIASCEDVSAMLEIGYQACQLGTRFIASTECSVSETYKKAIVDAGEDDIVLTEKMTGVPVSVINTGHRHHRNLKNRGIVSWMLGNPRLKHIGRLYLSLKTISDLKKAIHKDDENSKYWQAGKSVYGINEVSDVKQIVDELTACL